MRLQAQPLEVLTVLVERGGELVTREELRQQLWGADTYVDFDQGLNKAIKKIRAALGDAADEPKYVQTLARRGYRFIGGVTWDGAPSGKAGTNSQASDAQRAVVRRGRGWKLSMVIASVLIASAAIVTWVLVHHRSPAEVTHRTLTRITFDAGLQFGVTFSPDARFIAYSSDRGGKFDIWVQQIGGAQPHRITNLASQNWQPDWSPDGSQIVFRSEGDQAGLYVVPAFGGVERRISPFGYRPHWSPDGSQILFEGTFAPGLWSKVYLVAPDGQPPREILSGFFRKARITKRSVEWYPHTHRVSIWGECDEGRRFWTVDVTGEHAVKSAIPAAIDRELNEISTPVLDFRWSPRGDALFFDGESRGVRNVWRAKVEPGTLRWRSLERLTVSAGSDGDLAISGDTKLAFTSRTERVRIWRWPFDAKHGRTVGEGRPVTAPGDDAWMPDLSHDGKKLVFVTRRFEKWQLSELSLADGRETLLSDRNDICGEPRWSPDSALVLCTRSDTLDSPLLVAEGGGSEKRLVSSGFEASAIDWSPDGQFIVGASGPGEGESRGLPNTSMLLFPVSAAPHAETQARLITSARSEGFWQMRFSPDGRWIAFELVAGYASSGGGATDARLYVVSAAGGPWIPVTDGNAWDDKPRWSPDGKLLYFMSSRAGLLNVWAIEFDGVAGRTVGRPFAVTVFDSPGLMMPARDPSLLQVSISENSLVLPLAAVSGNLWLMENLDQ